MADQQADDGVFIFQDQDGAYYAIPRTVAGEYRIPQERQSEVEELLRGAGQTDVQGYDYLFSGGYAAVIPGGVVYYSPYLTPTPQAPGGARRH